MRSVLLTILLALAGCASTNYQVYEGRNQIIEGQGGTKEIIEGIEVWDNGSPPRRYKVLGVATVEDFDNAIGQSNIRRAIAEQVRQAGGDAGVMLDGWSQGQQTSVFVGPMGRTIVGTTSGRKQVRLQIIQYLDKSPTAPTLPATPPSTWIKS